MCGIVGRCSFNSIINQETLIAQRDALRHRGPDDKGIWCSNDSRVGLASIVGCQLLIPLHLDTSLCKMILVSTV